MIKIYPAGLQQRSNLGETALPAIDGVFTGIVPVSRACHYKIGIRDDFEVIGSWLFERYKYNG